MRRRAISARERAEAPQLGDRADGDAEPWAGQPAKPQRGNGLPARGGLLVRDRDPLNAYSVQDAYIYGFAQQEKTLGFQTPSDAGEAAQRRAQAIGALNDYPYLAEIATKLPESGYDNAVEFAWGLDLILDGLDRRRTAGP